MWHNGQGKMDAHHKTMLVNGITVFCIKNVLRLMHYAICQVHHYTNADSVGSDSPTNAG